MRKIYLLVLNKYKYYSYMYSMCYKKIANGIDLMIIMSKNTISCFLIYLLCQRNNS